MFIYSSSYFPPLTLPEKFERPSLQYRLIVRKLREQNAAQTSTAKEAEDVVRSLKMENSELIKQIEQQRYAGGMVQI